MYALFTLSPLSNKATWKTHVFRTRQLRPYTEELSTESKYLPPIHSPYTTQSHCTLGYKALPARLRRPAVRRMSSLLPLIISITLLRMRGLVAARLLMRGLLSVAGILSPVARPWGAVSWSTGAWTAVSSLIAVANVVLALGLLVLVVGVLGTVGLACGRGLVALLMGRLGVGCVRGRVMLGCLPAMLAVLTVLARGARLLPMLTLLVRGRRCASCVCTA